MSESVIRTASELDNLLQQLSEHKNLRAPNVARPEGWPDGVLEPVVLKNSTDPENPGGARKDMIVAINIGTEENSQTHLLFWDKNNEGFVLLDQHDVRQMYDLTLGEVHRKMLKGIHPVTGEAKTEDWTAQIWTKNGVVVENEELPFKKMWIDPDSDPESGNKVWKVLEGPDSIEGAVYERYIRKSLKPGDTVRGKDVLIFNDKEKTWSFGGNDDLWKREWLITDPQIAAFEGARRAYRDDINSRQGAGSSQIAYPEAVEGSQHIRFYNRPIAPEKKVVQGETSESRRPGELKKVFAVSASGGDDCGGVKNQLPAPGDSEPEEPEEPEEEPDLISTIKRVVPDEKLREAIISNFEGLNKGGQDRNLSTLADSSNPFSPVA